MKQIIPLIIVFFSFGCGRSHATITTQNPDQDYGVSVIEDTVILDGGEEVTVTVTVDNDDDIANVALPDAGVVDQSDYDNDEVCKQLKNKHKHVIHCHHDHD